MILLALPQTCDVASTAGVMYVQHWPKRRTRNVGRPGSRWPARAWTSMLADISQLTSAVLVWYQ